MMKLSWERIKEAFEGQWVELVRCDWDWDDAHPSWGVIRHHHDDRRGLLELIQASGSVEGSIIIHVSVVHPVLRRVDAVAAL